MYRCINTFYCVKKDITYVVNQVITFNEYILLEPTEQINFVNNISDNEERIY